MSSKYTHDEVVAASTEYFDGDELAATVFADKYALRDNDNNILELTPADMHRRMAKEFARIEEEKFEEPMDEEEIFVYLDHFQYIVPQGSCMFGIGNPYQYVSLSNCFVVGEPAHDSYGSIFAADEEIVQICKRRGGVGVDLSVLRPDGTLTHNAARASTGAVSFMRRYSNSIREVAQNGRRGALMETLHVQHPDVFKFIHAKDDKTQVTGANISVKLTDGFMRAVKDKRNFTLQWPINVSNPKITQEIDANDLWQKIIERAHAHGEPGVIFWDNVVKESISDCYLGCEVHGSNPCSEQMLPPYDACRLLVLVLFNYIDNPFTDKASFNFEKYKEHVRVAQRFADNIVDLDIECMERITRKIWSDPEDPDTKKRELNLWMKMADQAKATRRVGIGTTSLGDTFAALGIKYGSPESIKLTDKIFYCHKHACYQASVDMAEELGSFPLWIHKKEKDNPFLQRLREENMPLYTKMAKVGRRNILLTTQPPAGTLSIETQTTSGIEPLLTKHYTRRKKGNPGDTNFRVDFVDKTGDSFMHFDVVHPKLKQWMEVTGATDTEGSPWDGCLAYDLDWEKRIALQAAAQNHIDSSISVTINLSKEVPPETIGCIYMRAWEKGCKSVAVYRKGSRDSILLEDEEDVFPDKRPKHVPCDVYHISVKGNSYFVMVGLIGGKPYEVFAGRNGRLAKKITNGVITRKKKDFYKFVDEENDEELSPITSMCSDVEEAISRLVSGLLRSGADTNFIVTQLEKVGGEDMHNFAKAVARALKKYIPDGTKVESNCVECGGTNLERSGGCITCKGCGTSTCL